MFQTYRMELIKTALQGILSNNEIVVAASKKAGRLGVNQADIISEWSIELADVIINKLESSEAVSAQRNAAVSAQRKAAGL